MLTKRIRLGMKYIILWLLNFVVSLGVAKPLWYDSAATSRVERLAQRMKIKDPKLRSAEYQIRLWVKVELMFGDAQNLYVLDKRRNKLLLTQYAIESDTNYMYRSHTLVDKSVLTDVNVWRELVENDVLTLPDQSLLREQIFPKPIKDSSWVEIGSDGVPTVRARRKEATVLMGDGTSYHVQVFGSTLQRTYSYHCPAAYSRVRTKVVELQKVVRILNVIWRAFGIHSEICQVDAGKRNIHAAC